MKSGSSPIAPIKVREGNAKNAAPATPAGSLLHKLHEVAACGSFRAATEAVQAPETLAALLPVRTRRQMRTARVSWW